MENGAVFIGEKNRDKFQIDLTDMIFDVIGGKFQIDLTDMIF